MRRRRWKKAALAGVAIAVLAVAAHVYRLHRRGPVDVLPTFTEPGPGARAPRSEAFGLAVGRSGVDEAQALIARAGLECADTSIRATMARMREETRREMAARAARGEDPDAVTGASSVNRRSPKEANPQIRLSCEETPAHALPDRRRAEIKGRLLMVFDSAKHPLRLASFERTFPATDERLALDDLTTTATALASAYGTPTRGSLDVTQLPWLSPVEVGWDFADLRVRVSALHYGPRGIVVSEVVEVPWPVRANAPAPRSEDRGEVAAGIP